MSDESPELNGEIPLVARVQALEHWKNETESKPSIEAQLARLSENFVTAQGIHQGARRLDHKALLDAIDARFKRAARERASIDRRILDELNVVRGQQERITTEHAVLMKEYTTPNDRLRALEQAQLSLEQADRDRKAEIAALFRETGSVPPKTSDMMKQAAEISQQVQDLGLAAASKIIEARDSQVELQLSKEKELIRARAHLVEDTALTVEVTTKKKTASRERWEKAAKWVLPFLLLGAAAALRYWHL